MLGAMTVCDPSAKQEQPALGIPLFAPPSLLGLGRLPLYQRKCGTNSVSGGASFLSAISVRKARQTNWQHSVLI